ncbi:hypothetical protein RJT34_09762 [Clitoria ternatea]|uniref:RING-type E3 ubiquitin transferase n=1 Tax=Clitoria ternatea TaxID=43366 RepID=A0AAN9K5B1_CLITE
MSMILSLGELRFPALDESELQNYLVLKEGDIEDYFHVKVNVTHEVCVAYGQLVPINRFLFQGSMFVPVQDFLEDGPLCMRACFDDQIIPDSFLHEIMPNVTAYSRAEVQTSHPDSHNVTPNFRVFNLVLAIFITVIHEETNMSQVRMVPASKTAIESLQKAKLQDNATMEKCTICLTEFDKDAQVLLMPCKHVYHEECLIQWLQASHMCPLCRYPMSTL